MSNYLKVEISAEDKNQAYAVLDTLISKKLATGGQIIQTPARFLWKGEVVDMDYCTVTSFTLEKNKPAIIEAVKAVSVEEVPMVVFLPFDGNQELLNWVNTTLS